MYQVIKNGRKNKTLFPEYELARQFVRKQLRKLTLHRENGQPGYYMEHFGYRITKVN